MNAIQIILLILQGLISIALVAIVMSQTTKNEGLTGTIGGNVSANFKGKPGFEERMQDYTRYLGIAWFAISILVGIAFRNYTG
jgi:preprotein translocase subunit SecG